MKLTFLFFVCALMMVLSGSLWAWDCFYDCSVLPNDPSLDANKWGVGGIGSGLSMFGTTGDLLVINDTSSTDYVFFSRYVPASTPVTMEARVRLISGSGAYMGIATPSFVTGVGLCSDHLVVGFDYVNPPVTYTVDWATFHIIRIAIDAQGQSFVWLDQTPVATGTTNVGGQTGVHFGSSTYTSRSYWDYVAYSESFEPVPEPGSLVALCAGLIPLAFRRRRG